MFTGEGVVDSVRNRPAIIVRGYITGYSIASNSTRGRRYSGDSVVEYILAGTGCDYVGRYEPRESFLKILIPNGRKNPQPIEVIDRYVGVYRINEKTVRYVTRQGNRLFTQRAGYRKLEPIPAGDGIFFYPNSLSYCEFVINDSDVVTHMLLHMADLQERAERTDEPLPIPL